MALQTCSVDRRTRRPSQHALETQMHRKALALIELRPQDVTLRIRASFWCAGPFLLRHPPTRPGRRWLLPFSVQLCSRRPGRNSGMLEITLSMRKTGRECGSVVTIRRAICWTDVRAPGDRRSRGRIAGGRSSRRRLYRRATCPAASTRPREPFKGEADSRHCRQCLRPG